jgi:hypothetical protein
MTVDTEVSETRFVRVMVRPDGLDPYAVVAEPPVESAREVLFDEEMPDMTCNVKVFENNESKPKLDLLEWEAVDLALGILHAVIAYRGLDARSEMQKMLSAALGVQL